MVARTEAQKQAARDRTRRWNLQNPERAKANKKLSYQKRCAYYLQRAKEYRAKNPEFVKKCSVEWAKRNREYVYAQQGAWRKANKERVQERNLVNKKRWRANNPDRALIQDRNHKARRKGAVGSFKRSDIERICKEQRNSCAYCRIKFSRMVRFEIDHITAISKGGSNYPANLQLLCKACNAKKNASDPIDFVRAEYGMLL